MDKDGMIPGGVSVTDLYNSWRDLLPGFISLLPLTKTYFATDLFIVIESQSLPLLTDETIDHFALSIKCNTRIQLALSSPAPSRVLDSNLRTCLPAWRLLLIAHSTLGFYKQWVVFG
jgi:hypothetical protein